MKILSIETSCDETAISVIEIKENNKKPVFKILADTVISQINLHKKYGGVFPALAKREHTKNLLPILITTLKKAGLLKTINRNNKKFTVNSLQLTVKTIEKVNKIMEREPELAEKLLNFLNKNEIPKIDAVAVTQGPGLEPALWTGINFAKVLALIWDKPFIPVNHMEGHFFSVLADRKQFSISNFQFPILGLLISGGHTQLVLMKDFDKFKIIGQTRDDAVGEAYDKVARMLDLPYPGGPEISNLSEQYSTRRRTSGGKIILPRPMLNTPDFDFSFSGLKTAVLYMIKNLSKLTPNIKKEISYEFENAVTDVLLHKTKKAIEKYKIKTLILGGGVVANERIRKTFKDLESENLSVLIPDIKYTGDNAVMIGIAGYFRYLDNKALNPDKTNKIKADGNMRL